MAQKTVVTLYDDKEAHEGNGDVEAAETVEFALDGQAYEIDLSTVNASDLRQRLEEFIPAARKKSARARKASSGANPSAPKASSSGSASADREHNKKVRAFWKEVVDTVPNAVPGVVPKFAERGRIPDTVTELYASKGGDASKVSAGTASNDSVSAPAPVNDTGAAQSADSTVEDENLPEGWFRDNEGQLRDEDGFDREESELSNA